jgi:Lon protease-like protein
MTTGENDSRRRVAPERAPSAPVPATAVTPHPPAALRILVQEPLFPHCTTVIVWYPDRGATPVAGDQLLVLPGYGGDAGDLQIRETSAIGRLATLVDVLSVSSSSLKLHGRRRVRLTAVPDALDPLRAAWEDLDERVGDPAVAKLVTEVRRMARRAQKTDTLLVSAGELDVNDLDPGRLACRLAQSLTRPEQRQHAFAAGDLPSLLAEVLRLLRHSLRRSQYSLRRHPRPSQFNPDYDEALEARALRAVPEALRPLVQRDIDNGEDRALERIASFPWADPVIPPMDVAEVTAALNRSHSGMDGAKQQVVDALIHADWRRQHGLPPSGVSMLLDGPPGVGKSTFCSALASATGRAYIRIAMGSDSDTIRLLGTTRTWAKSDIGEICRALIAAGTRYCLIQFDEVDKQGQSSYGQETEAVLLTLTDPSQNTAVQDVWLQLPMDLSPALFVFTCNRLDKVSRPLRDRCTVIELPGYSAAEKRGLIASHLWPRFLAENAIEESTLLLSAAAQDTVAARHELEPGLRGIERDLRTLAVRALPSLLSAGVVTVGVEDVIRELGPPPKNFFHLPAVPPPGQCLALAMAGSVGVVLPLQVVTWPGSGRIRTSGLLGTEFEQSILTCLAYLRVHGQEIGVDAADLDRRDIHVHLPGGGVTKDGPSAGAAVLAGLVSALKGKALPGDVAVTGEVDAHGALLSVGGLPAKLMGAQAGKLRAVLIPAGNDTEDPLAVPVANAMEMFRYLGLIDAQPTPENGARRRPRLSHRNARAKRQQASRQPVRTGGKHLNGMRQLEQRLTTVVAQALRRHLESGAPSNERG